MHNGELAKKYQVPSFTWLIRNECPAKLGVMYL